MTEWRSPDRSTRSVRIQTRAEERGGGGRRPPASLRSINVHPVTAYLHAKRVSFSSEGGPEDLMKHFRFLILRFLSLTNLRRVIRDGAVGSSWSHHYTHTHAHGLHGFIKVMSRNLSYQMLVCSHLHYLYLSAHICSLSTGACTERVKSAQMGQIRLERYRSLEFYSQPQ